MSAGRRDQRVRFERETLTPDGMGGGSKAWALLFKRWCEVRPISGSERAQADQLEAARNYRITVPRDAETGALLPSDRIVWLGKTAQIRFIADEGPAKREMRIDVELGVDL